MSKPWSSTEVQLLLSATAGTDQQHKGSQQGFEIKIKIEIGSCLTLGVHPATGQWFEINIKIELGSCLKLGVQRKFKCC